MTIAACYVSCEGVILGADSTTTYFDAHGRTRHYNNAQKIFEVGEMGSSLGIVTWGLGGIQQGKSYRQLAAEVSDQLIKNHPPSVEEAAHRWAGLVWAEYSAKLRPIMDLVNALSAKTTRTPREEMALARFLQNFFVGFCIGGHVHHDRTPRAFQVQIGPNMTGPQIVPIKQNLPVFWGVPNYMDRLLRGIDTNIYKEILAKWPVPKADLDAVIETHAPTFALELPLREAIDWIFSAIFITIKGMKFSEEPLYCGGPVEVAVITADRRFRWVSHKGLDQALSDHSARGTY